MPSKRSDNDNTPPYEIVRLTCREFKTDRVKFDEQAAQQYVNELLAGDNSDGNNVGVQAVKDFGVSLANDSNFTGTSCKFKNVDTEAAFIVMLHALDFGSGWRKQLHKHNNGKGAWLSIKPGIENYYNLHPTLTSKELMEATKEEVSEAFNFQNIDDLDDLVTLLHQVIVDLGKQTYQLKYESLVEFTADKLSKAWTTNPTTTNTTQAQTTPAGNLVWDLVETFPDTFDDNYYINGQRVCLYKKAQLVVGELYHRFRNEDERFNFVDGDKLTAYIDNVICASMRYKKIVVPCKELETKIEKGIEILKGSEDEVALRSKAMVGVEYVASNTGLTSPELGNYLWAGLGKLPQVRKFQRHATKTVFY